MFSSASSSVLGKFPSKSSVGQIRSSSNAQPSPFSNAQDTEFKNFVSRIQEYVSDSSQRASTLAQMQTDWDSGIEGKQKVLQFISGFDDLFKQIYTAKDGVSVQQIQSVSYQFYLSSYASFASEKFQSLLKNPPAALKKILVQVQQGSASKLFERAYTMAKSLVVGEEPSAYTIHSGIPSSSARDLCAELSSQVPVPENYSRHCENAYITRRFKNS
ncbi:MAG: hypothetical protein V4591_03955 [Bdellovibrionota bacterium]